MRSTVTRIIVQDYMSKEFYTLDFVVTLNLQNLVHSTDLAIKMCVFYAEPHISRVAISSGRARAISRNLVHSLKTISLGVCLPLTSDRVEICELLSNSTSLDLRVQALLSP